MEIFTVNISLWKIHELILSVSLWNNRIKKQ